MISIVIFDGRISQLPVVLAKTVHSIALWQRADDFALVESKYTKRELWSAWQYWLQINWGRKSTDPNETRHL